jgi:hypothetical protein
MGAHMTTERRQETTDNILNTSYEIHDPRTVDKQM